MPARADQSEPVITDIVALNPAGQGLSVHEGSQVAVHGALPGETVSIRQFGGRRGKSRAELLEVLTESAKRVKPRCPHFGICGACKLQHLGHAEQLAFKQAQLTDCLVQAGGIEPSEWLQPLVGPLWQYRRKARLSVRWVEKKGRILVGFRELNGRYVADLGECHILDARIGNRLPQLATLIAGLSIYKRIPQLEIACGDELAAMVLRILEPLSSADECALRDFSQQTGLAVFVQTGGPGSITALAPQRVQLEYAIPEHEVKLRFGPANFIQVNSGLNQLMVNRVLELLDVNHGDTIIDLFCGLGNFTLPIAKYAGAVFGLEGDAELVTLARKNAMMNQLENTRFDVADLAIDGVSLPQWTDRADKVLLDPPRSGAAAILPSIAASAANKLVYVSCNPVTLAEDANQLVLRHGFQLQAAGIMDMFPHTAHIESCALFTR